MATWAEFEGAAPQLAGKGRALQYQYGPLLGYLAIVRPKERIFGATPVSRSTPSLRRMLTTNSSFGVMQSRWSRRLI
jgi:hypothetical protein